MTRLELQESVTTLHSSLRPREDLSSVECRSRDPTSLRGRRGQHRRLCSAAFYFTIDRPRPYYRHRESLRRQRRCLYCRARGSRTRRGVGHGTKCEWAAAQAAERREGGRKEQGRDGMDVDCIDTDRIKRNKIAARNANAREELPLVIHSPAAWRTVSQTWLQLIKLHRSKIEKND